MSIPKILHFTWKTDDVPGKMGIYLAKWRALHPHWDVRLWTDASMRDFVAATYPDFLHHYDGYRHPIQRADSFRYLVLLAMGGVYSDLDVEPFQPIDVLVEGLTSFAGVEPDEHMGADRHHSGTPYLISNAFMGAVPGHAYFKQLVDLLPIVASNPDIFLSTGPALTTGGAVRMARADKPVLVPPCLWSPLCDGGKPCRTDDKLAAILSGDFDFVWLDRQKVVSHYWLTSWVPWDKRHAWLAKPFHLLHDLKWALRAWRAPQLAAFDPLNALQSLNDQAPKPLTELPKIAICIALRGAEKLSLELIETLSELDYTRDHLSLYLAGFAGAETALADSKALLAAQGFADVTTIVAPPMPPHDKAYSSRSQSMIASAHLRNALAQPAGKANAWLLFLDEQLEDVPVLALKQALAVGHPVVGMAMVDAAGKEVDPSVYRYHWGGGIRVSYKIRGEDGVGDNLRGQRDWLTNHKAFRLLALDGVGTGFTLIRADVFAAGVTFAQEPYKLHLDGEGLALMARAEGFEVVGLTECVVRRA